MALSIQQIATLYSYEFYEFGIYFSPANFKQAVNAINKVTIANVQRLKFDNKITNKLVAGRKGIYVFTIEELAFPHIDFRYLLYIGRTIKTNSFKKRFYKYRASIGSKSGAQNIVLLTNLWPDNTYVYFLEIKNDKEITEVEQILVHKIKPNFNEEYFTTRTVESTSLYKIANP